MADTLVHAAPRQCSVSDSRGPGPGASIEVPARDNIVCGWELCKDVSHSLLCPQLTHPTPAQRLIWRQIYIGNARLLPIWKFYNHCLGVLVAPVR